MHHRYYSPILGHFLTPDFRAPDIYDPTTFSEPYAYAAGNPFMYWDPDGLQKVFSLRKEGSSFSEYIYLEDDEFNKMRRGMPFEFSHGGQTYFWDETSTLTPFKRQERFLSLVPGMLFGSGQYSLTGMENAQGDAMIAVASAIAAPFAFYYGGVASLRVLAMARSAGSTALLFARDPRLIYGHLATNAITYEEAGRAASEVLFDFEMGPSAADLLPSGAKRQIAGAVSDSMEDMLAPFRGRADEILEQTRLNYPGSQGMVMMDGADEAAIRNLFGEGPETSAINLTSRYRMGMTRQPRHHVFPQEYRSFFEERGFTGSRNIDMFTLELDEAIHQAIHGGGNWRLGRKWQGEWNRKLMDDIISMEEILGRKLNFEEVFSIGEDLMNSYDLNGLPFIRY